MPVCWWRRRGALRGVELFVFVSSAFLPCRSKGNYISVQGGVNSAHENSNPLRILHARQTQLLHVTLLEVPLDVNVAGPVLILRCISAYLALVAVGTRYDKSANVVSEVFR